MCRYGAPASPHLATLGARVRCAEVERRSADMAVARPALVESLERGVPLEVISRQLGHAEHAITADVYAHVGQAAHREAADTMQAALED
jgi:integrase